MHIEVHVETRAAERANLVGYLKKCAAQILRRQSADLTRVDVQVSPAPYPQMRICRVEARLAGAPPVAATHRANSTHSAGAGALKKLRAALETKIARRRNHRGRASPRNAALSFPGAAF